MRIGSQRAKFVVPSDEHPVYAEILFEDAGGMKAIVNLGYFPPNFWAFNCGELKGIGSTLQVFVKQRLTPSAVYQIQINDGKMKMANDGSLVITDLDFLFLDY